MTRWRLLMLVFSMGLMVLAAVIAVRQFLRGEHWGWNGAWAWVAMAVFLGAETWRHWRAARREGT